MSIDIRKKLTDHSEWKRLWQDYLIFYKSEDFQDVLTEILW